MEALLEKWSLFISRWSLLIVIVWILLVIVAFRFAPSITSVAAQQKIATLPATAESVQADKLYGSKFAVGQQAVNTETDLIILSTHGHTGFKHVLLGSVAENVVRHAPCPVLIVRQQEHEFITK